ncbi:hypothetical protein MMC26_007640 [Xylographa opegraphella]|nr:hypothetical protein [Xylographa opegraphella]
MSAFLTLPNEVLQQVAFGLVESDDKLRYIKNIHRDLVGLGCTCRRLSAIVTPALYRTVKFISNDNYKYDAPRRIGLLWRTLDANRILGEYVRTLFLTQTIDWDWSPLLSLLPNLQRLTIPSGAATGLRSIKLPLLSYLSYDGAYNEPLPDFPWEVLFQPSIRHLRYCSHYSGTEGVKPPPLPLDCVSRSSPLTHIEFTITYSTSARLVYELLSWSTELLSFSLGIDFDVVNIAGLVKALAPHRTSLKHFRFSQLPGSAAPSLEILDLKLFERLENLELEWNMVYQSPPAAIPQNLPSCLVEIALTNYVDHGRSWLNAAPLEWLIRLAKVLKTAISSLQTLKLRKHSEQYRQNRKDFVALKRVVDAWNKVGVKVVWDET